MAKVSVFGQMDIQNQTIYVRHEKLIFISPVSLRNLISSAENLHLHYNLATHIKKNLELVSLKLDGNNKILVLQSKREMF